MTRILAFLMLLGPFHAFALTVQELKACAPRADLASQPFDDVSIRNTSYQFRGNTLLRTRTQPNGRKVTAPVAGPELNDALPEALDALIQMYPGVIAQSAQDGETDLEDHELASVQRDLKFIANRFKSCAGLPRLTRTNSAYSRANSAFAEAFTRMKLRYTPPSATPARPAPKTSGAH